MRLTARIAVSGLLLGLALAPSAGAQSDVLAPTSACPGQTRPSAPVAVQERAMRCLINYARTHSGGRPLASSGKLGRSANGKARDIIRCGRLTHNACGRQFTHWFDRVGFLRGCFRVGESVALGTLVAGSARSIMTSWLRSASARETLLTRVFREQGVATRLGRVGRIPRAHVWVVHLGAHLPGTC
jgi:uncharacterized protein YkwD